ncbi:hypothetical protein BT96DRAFT_1005243 [Gymnopus androsaceus JB14]|uniref:Uncharacterized protein n=1 Tax=Gymnopus androsaceus JB14 TaxID=1447944 RepID=A0A6A4GQ35_9AGAR|nr:hypothetical protein BT96DRAFT_1005243 [Gymnopus androsaceus JB14]
MKVKSTTLPCRRYRIDLESWRSNVASNFSTLELRMQNYLQKPEQVNSWYHAPFDFRQDYAARKSFGLCLLPAYIHAKKLGQHSQWLTSIVYGRDFEEDPDEDMKRFLWKSLPDDAGCLLRRNTLANLTLSMHISDSKVRIKGFIAEHGTAEAAVCRGFLQQALESFLERVLKHPTAVVAVIQKESWLEELLHAVVLWTRLNCLPFQFLAVHAPFTPYIPFSIAPEAEPCAELRPWADSLSWVYPEREYHE